MKQKHILFVGLLSFLVVSCSDLEQMETYTGGSVKVTAGIAGSRVGFSEMDNVTYARWQDGDGITLSTESQGNLDYTALVSSGVSDEVASVLTFEPEGTSLKDIDGEEVYACYPSSEITSGVVPLPSTAEWNDNRPMPFAYAVSSIRDSEVSLQFKHIFSYLKLTVTPEILSDPGEAIRKVTVSTSSASPLSTGEGDTFDFSTLEADITHGSNLIQIPTDTLLVESGWTVYIPVLPQPSDADITITLTGAEDEVLYTHTKATPSTGFEAGNVYRVGTAVASSYLVDGPTFNAAIKDLVNGIATSRGVYDIDEKIAKIEFFTEVQTVPEEYIVVSAEGSPAPIYASFNATDSLLTVLTPAKDMEVVDASEMFCNLHSLRTVDLGKFGVNAKTTDMRAMFWQCLKLTTLDVSDWDTSNVTNMGGTFSHSGLTSLDVSGWNTSSVIYMNHMFSGTGITSLDVSGWNTSKVTTIKQMFNYCNELISLDVSRWDTSSVTDMMNVFGYCSGLTTLDVSNWNVSKVTNMFQMFSDCSSLVTLDVSNWNISNVTDMGGMFYFCKSLTTLDVSNWDTGKVTSMVGMFHGCSALSTLNVSDWNTSSVPDLHAIFSDCSSVKILDVSKWNTANVTSMRAVFSGCSSLSDLEISNWNTANVTDMSSIFSGCSEVTTLNVSDWDTSNVTDMSFVFGACPKMTTLDISKWSFKEDVDLSHMFNNCASTSQSCKITATPEAKALLLNNTETTKMNTAWFIWTNGKIENDGSSVEDLPNLEW